MGDIDGYTYTRAAFLISEQSHTHIQLHTIQRCVVRLVLLSPVCMECVCVCVLPVNACALRRRHPTSYHTSTHTSAATRRLPFIYNGVWLDKQTPLLLSVSHSICIYFLYVFGVAFGPGVYTGVW